MYRTIESLGPIARPSGPPPALYRGRRWAAAAMLALAAAAAVAAAATARLDDPWLALAAMGLPLAASACLCALHGWGEAIARVRLDEAGLSLVLPRYRGLLPLWPAQRLTAAWPEIRQLRRRRRRARVLGLAVDYIERRIVTDRGNAVLIEALPTKHWGAARGVGCAIPAAAIAAEIERRSGVRELDDGDCGGAAAGRRRDPGQAAGGPRRASAAAWKRLWFF